MTLSRAQAARIRQIARGRSDEPLHVLEGPKAVREAIGRGDVAELWLRTDLEEDLARELRSLADGGGVPVGEARARDLDRLGDTVSPQGVLALVRDTACGVADALALDGPLLWLDGLQDPGNVGAVVRVAAAFGVGGLLVGEGCADPLGLKALRASAGLALTVPFARASAAGIAAACREGGRPVWALDRGGDDVLGIEGPPPGNLVLAVGAEGPGLGEEAREAAARRLGIPLAQGVDSLNAAVAVGIAVACLFGRGRAG
jgi:TrmH family RNA methyltransferase